MPYLTLIGLTMLASVALFSLNVSSAGTLLLVEGGVIILIVIIWSVSSLKATLSNSAAQGVKTDIQNTSNPESGNTENDSGNTTGDSGAKSNTPKPTAPKVDDSKASSTKSSLLTWIIALLLLTVLAAVSWFIWGLATTWERSFLSQDEYNQMKAQKNAVEPKAPALRSGKAGKIVIQSDGMTILVKDPLLTKVEENEEEVTFKRTSAYDLRFRKESQSFRIVIYNCPEAKKQEVRKIAEQDLIRSLELNDKDTFCHLRLGLYYIPGRMKVSPNDTNWGISFCNKHKNF